MGQFVVEVSVEVSDDAMKALSALHSGDRLVESEVDVVIAEVKRRIDTGGTAFRLKPLGFSGWPMLEDTEHVLSFAEDSRPSDVLLGALHDYVREVVRGMYLND